MTKAFLGAFTLSVLLTPVFRLIALRLGALDEPGGSKLHPGPVPYLGGLAMYLAFLLGAALGAGMGGTSWKLLSSGALVLAVGLYDDLRGCPPKLKLSLLASASLVAAGLGLRPESVFFGGPLQLGCLSWPAAVMWLVVTSTALDLTDGLDGLAAGVTFIASAFVSALALVWGDMVPAVLASSLAGACLGFLVYNFPPARIFMGDAGSLFLGFSLGGISLGVGPEGSSALPCAALVLGLPMLDTSAALIRRALSGRSIFLADTEHFHHRLLRLGLSRRRAVLILYAAAACSGLYAIAAAGSGTSLALGLGAIPTLALLLSLGSRR